MGPVFTTKCLSIMFILITVFSLYISVSDFVHDFTLPRILLWPYHYQECMLSSFIIFLLHTMLKYIG
jgi:hypothetical protein